MPRARLTFIAAAILAAALAVEAAHAQPAPSLVEPKPPAAPEKPGSETAPPPQSEDGSKTTQEQESAPLSDKLKESEGVIEPSPGADPDIQKPTPDINSKMPVIPPPGEPGGDPNVQPK